MGQTQVCSLQPYQHSTHGPMPHPAEHSFGTERKGGCILEYTQVSWLLLMVVAVVAVSGWGLTVTFLVRRLDKHTT